MSIPSRVRKRTCFWGVSGFTFTHCAVWNAGRLASCVITRQKTPQKFRRCTWTHFNFGDPYTLNPKPWFQKHHICGWGRFTVICSVTTFFIYPTYPFDGRVFLILIFGRKRIEKHNISIFRISNPPLDVLQLEPTCSIEVVLNFKQDKRKHHTYQWTRFIIYRNLVL